VAVRETRNRFGWCGQPGTQHRAESGNRFSAPSDAQDRARQHGRSWFGLRREGAASREGSRTSRKWRPDDREPPDARQCFGPALPKAALRSRRAMRFPAIAAPPRMAMPTANPGDERLLETLKSASTRAAPPPWRAAKPTIAW